MLGALDHSSKIIFYILIPGVDAKLKKFHKFSEFLECPRKEMLLEAQKGTILAMKVCGARTVYLSPSSHIRFGHASDEVFAAPVASICVKQHLGSRQPSQ